MSNQTLAQIVEQYAPDTPQIREQQLKGIDAKLHELRTEGAFGIETRAADRLRSMALEAYPKIDLSFLEYGIEKEFSFQGHAKDNVKPSVGKLFVPRFAPVFYLSEGISLTLSGECYHSDSEGYRVTLGLEYGPSGIKFSGRRITIGPETTFLNDLPKQIQVQLIRVLSKNFEKPEPFKHGEYHIQSWEAITGGYQEQFREKPNRFTFLGNFERKNSISDFSFDLKASLNCLVPTKTRGRIRQFERIFYPSNNLPWTREKVHKYNNEDTRDGNIPPIYFVSEVTAKDWEAEQKPRPRFEKDPLVIGFPPNGSQAYLIDKFDATPLENYASKEFTT